MPVLKCKNNVSHFSSDEDLKMSHDEKFHDWEVLEKYREKKDKWNSGYCLTKQFCESILPGLLVWCYMHVGETGYTLMGRTILWHWKLL